MSISITVEGELVTCNGKKAKHTPHNTYGREVYMLEKEYVIKLDVNGYYHDDMGIWESIEPEDREYFVPCLAEGETDDGIRWSVQPYVQLKGRKTAKAESIVEQLIYKYDLHDMHESNWAMCNGKPIIFDYGMIYE